MSPRSQGCSAVSESIATIEVSACDLARIESCGGRLTVGAIVRKRLAERPADVTKSVPLLARVVLTGVADTPFRATAAEAVLQAPRRALPWSRRRRTRPRAVWPPV